MVRPVGSSDFRAVCTMVGDNFFENARYDRDRSINRSSVSQRGGILNRVLCHGKCTDEGRRRVVVNGKTGEDDFLAATTRQLYSVPSIRQFSTDPAPRRYVPETKIRAQRTTGYKTRGEIETSALFRQVGKYAGIPLRIVRTTRVFRRRDISLKNARNLIVVFIEN